MRPGRYVFAWLILLLIAACGSDGTATEGAGEGAGASGAGSGGVVGSAGVTGIAGNAAGNGGGGASGSGAGSVSGSGAISGDGGTEDGCIGACGDHGSCDAAVCECDPGYQGASCERCADGYQENAEAGICVSDLCDPDPCTGKGEVCDPVTGSCCSMECEVGASECEAGEQTVCEETIPGCSAWSAAVPCDFGNCFCAFTDPDVRVNQWTGENSARGRAVIVRGNEVIVAGGFGGSFNGYTPAGKLDMYVRAQVVESAIRLSDSWVVQWGTSETDIAGALEFGGGGELFVGGEIGGPFDGEPYSGLSDGSVTKWNADRTLAWHHQWGTSSVEGVHDLTLDANGNVYFVGYTGGSLTGDNQGVNDAIVRKLDAQGNEVWTRQWGAAGYDEASTVLTRGADEVWVGGIFDTDGFCRKLDGDGNELWTGWVSSSGDEAVWDMVLLEDDSLIVVGGTDGHIDGGTGGCFVSRIEDGGAVLWTDQFGFKTSDYARGVALGPDGDVYIVGEIDGELVPGAHVGGDDMFVQRRTIDGDVVWTKQIGGTAHERGYGIDVAADGTVYAVGQSEGYYPGFLDPDRVLAAVLIRITQ